MHKSLLGLLMLAVAACKPAPDDTLIVVVYPLAGRCAIWKEAGEEPVDCRKVGEHLRDVLKVQPDRDISISLTGGEDVPKEDRSIDLIAERVRAAGFTKVRTARFGWQ